VIAIRDMEQADVSLLKHMIDEMGTHERMNVTVTEERLAADAFGPQPKFRALIAEVDGRIAGYALFFDCYSSFQGRGVFLEDLYVRGEFRGLRVGRALLSRVAGCALERECFGMMLNVLSWNEPALKFFEGAGASVLHGRETLSFKGSALGALVETDPFPIGGQDRRCS
jgi:GNAT superfamily N-acetyltransferase